MALVRSILNLSSTLRLDTVAEGIEESEQHEVLRGLGAQHGQGYLFARPMGPDDLGDLLAGARPRIRARPARPAIRAPERPAAGRPVPATSQSHPLAQPTTQRGSHDAHTDPARHDPPAAVSSPAGRDRGDRAGRLPGRRDPPRTITLQTLNDSGVTGTVSFAALGDRTGVEITVDPGGNPDMPAHIHPGTCANLTPQPKFPLENVAERRLDDRRPGLDRRAVRRQPGRQHPQVERRPQDVHGVRRHPLARSARAAPRRRPRVPLLVAGCIAIAPA